MSDLISTPSQAPSTVSSDTFEALIDLLTTDGVDQDAPSLPRNATRPHADLSLRDGSGKLDFDKIRFMFASQNASNQFGEETDEGDSDGGETRSSVDPSRTNSPVPLERATSGHRRSSTFGNQPWTATHGGNVAEAKADVALTPLSFDDLNKALASAHEDVRIMRQRYEQLEALVSKCVEAKAHAKPTPGPLNTDVVKSYGHVKTRDTGSQAPPTAVESLSPLPPDVPAEIANLSANEAKKVLNALVRSLNLSPGIINSLATTPCTSTSPQQSFFPPSRQHDVASISRAVKFLGTVDELVWRRTAAPSGPRTMLPTYSEENVIALQARLELWERAVRRSSRF